MNQRLSWKRFLLTTVIGPVLIAVVFVGFAPKALGQTPMSSPAAIHSSAQVTVGGAKIKRKHHHKRDVYEQLVKRLPLRVRQAFAKLGGCESTNNIKANTGNGFYGWLQFTGQTWHALGYKDMPHQASRAKQLWAGFRNARIQGWGAWPVCSRKVGITGLNVRAVKLRHG